MQTSPARAPRVKAVLPLLVAAAVTAGIYVWAKSISPDYSTSLFGQSAADTLPLKSWLATAVLALAVLQLYTALWLYGRLHRSRAKPRRLGRIHRLTGAAAILVSLPVAYHCLFAYGFRDFDTRMLVHSLAGCFFYGALAAKIVVVRTRGRATWAIPLAGGTLLTLVVVLWYSTAAWYFNDSSVPLFDSGTKAASPAPSYGGPSAVAPTGEGGNTVRVEMRNIQFAPRHVAAKVGQTVIWTNRDRVDHNVTAVSGASFHSSTLGTGATFRYRLAAAGKLTYACTIHQGMTGSVTVAK
jgi:plastocyanin